MCWYETSQLINMNVIEVARVWLWYLLLCLLFECNFQEDISIQLGLHAELIITRLTQIYFTSEHYGLRGLHALPLRTTTSKQHTLSCFNLSCASIQVFIFTGNFLHEMLSVSMRTYSMKRQRKEKNQKHVNAKKWQLKQLQREILLIFTRVPDVNLAITSTSKTVNVGAD